MVLVQEYADEGDLLQLTTQHDSQLSERSTIQLVLLPLLKAMYYMHSKSIIHRCDSDSVTLSQTTYYLASSITEYICALAATNKTFATTYIIRTRDIKVW